MAGPKKIILYNPRPNPHLKPLDVPLALLAISRFLDRDGWNIKIIAENLYKNHFDLIREEAPKAAIFGVSSMTGFQILNGIKASRIAKEANKDIKIIWGGWHPSLYPAQTLQNEYIDIVIKGQGEKAFYETASRVSSGQNLEGILGVYWKENGKIYSNPNRQLEPLDGMPAVPYHLIDLEKCMVETEFGSRTINYVSSYGCPFRCGFCCEQTVNARIWVGLNSESVLDELQNLQKGYYVNGISMYDSNFFVDMKRAKAILKGMLERKLTLRLGNIDGRSKQLVEADDELWELLRQTRSYSILTGAESGSQDALDLINKDLQVDDNIKFAQKCHKYGIKVFFSTLAGLPISDKNYKQIAQITDRHIKSTLEMFDKVLALDSRHRALMFLYCPYPGTPLYEKALKLGFKEPESLQEWSAFGLYRKHTPWVSRRQEFLVGMLSSYIFMFLDSDTILWVKQRIRNKFIRGIFILIFSVFAKMARLRWKDKYFGWPLDYYLFLFAKSRNKSI